MVADKSVYSLNYGFKKSSNHKKVSLRIFVFGIYSNHRIVVFNVRTLCRNFTFVQKEKGQAL